MQLTPGDRWRDRVAQPEARLRKVKKIAYKEVDGFLNTEKYADLVI